MQARIAQRPYAFEFSLGCNFKGIAITQNNALQLFSDRHYLINADTPFISIIASAATYRLISYP